MSNHLNSMDCRREDIGPTEEPVCETRMLLNYEVWLVWIENFSFSPLECLLHHHHHVAPSARISLTLSCHPSLSFIATSRSSGLHPVSAQSCCMQLLAGRPVFSRPCEGVHRNSSLMSSSLLHQHCPACLVRLTWIVFVMGGKCRYSCCFEGCWHQDSFNIARSILV